MKLQKAILDSGLNQHKLMDTSQYFHILNKQETEVFCKALEEVFYQIFDLEIEKK